MSHNYIKEKESEEDDKILNSEFKRISNKLKKLKSIAERDVIKEFLRSPFNYEVNIYSSQKILNKFNLEIEDLELENLINELIEEIELEDFEYNLENKNHNLTIPKYDSLNGLEFESFLKILFEALNYIVVQTKASGDQGADLLISKDNIKTVVQAKKYVGKVSNSAIQEVVASKSHYKCKEALVVTTSEFTKGAIELALSNKVELWNKKNWIL